MTVRSLFKRATKWTQGEFFREAGDTSPEKCYCLLGALQHVHGIDGKATLTKAQRERYHRAQLRVIVAIRKLFPSRAPFSGPIVTFNDHQDTTIADIRKVVRLARV